MTWPAHLPVAQVRFARPTNDLEAALRFYRDDLGLPELFRFEGHDGYDGVMLGLPGSAVHLELTHHPEVDGRASSREQQLVLYLGTRDAVAAAVARLTAAGHEPVEPENPYWTVTGAVAFDDADGWRLVLAAEPGI